MEKLEFHVRNRDAIRYYLSYTMEGEVMLEPAANRELLKNVIMSDKDNFNTAKI
jgi:hypothetical protein